MRVLILLALLLSACTSSPIGPSAQSTFSYPPELAPVIELIDADPWIHPLIGEPSGQWARRYVRRIELDPALVSESLRAKYDHGSGVIYWSPQYTPTNSMSAQILAGLLLHEARHGQGYRHSCPNKAGADRTVEEGGAVAVELAWLEHHALHESAAHLRRSAIGC